MGRKDEGEREGGRGREREREGGGGRGRKLVKGGETYPLSISSLTISFCDVSIALMIGVPPFTDCASIFAPVSSSSFTKPS